MKTNEKSERTEAKYNHCQINYTSTNIAFILPTRKAINRFKNGEVHHSGEKQQREQTSSASLSSSSNKTREKNQPGKQPKAIRSLKKPFGKLSKAIRTQKRKQVKRNE